MAVPNPAALRSPTPTLPGAWPNISQQLFEDFSLATHDASLPSGRDSLGENQPAGPDFLADLHRPASSHSGHPQPKSETPDASSSLDPNQRDFFSPLSTSSDLAVVSYSATASTFGTSSQPSSPLTPLDSDVFHHSQSYQDPSVATIRSPTDKNTISQPPGIHTIKLPPPPLDLELASSAPSPSFAYMSPRPLPELPSLTSSFSTASSNAYMPTLDSRSGPMVLPHLPHSDMSQTVIVTGQSVESGHVLPSASSTNFSSSDAAASEHGSESPINLFNLSEPHSPDSAHFSPVHEIISFASPSSSQFQLSLPQTPSGGGASTDSVVTYLQLPDGSPPLPTSASAAATNGHVQCSAPRQEVYEDRSEFRETTQPIEHIAVDTRPVKRSLLGKVKRWGGRIKGIFKAGSQPASASNTASVAATLVSPHATTPVVPVFLRPAESPSPNSHDARRSQTPPPAIVSFPPSPSRLPPPPRPHSPAANPQRQSRRFSLPTVFFSRRMASASPLVPARAPSPLVVVGSHTIDADESDNEPDPEMNEEAMMVNWSGGGPGGSRFQADDVVRGLGIGLPSARRMSAASK
ncbi:hypothetical protein FA95DRAFT_1563561 [Auriscalpium vulgare]|uniref:Uncharacterized protein n=1 Tax=Auriscalpium vulgare TaxID=40419 RepID=A0ACB8RG74_9AGAM|nr:hypothetical protein FA95DRAFT_1563561 [Auriscalpium vulgare]